MALIKYTAQQPPSINQRLFLLSEFKRVEISINTIVDLFAAIGVPVEIGPANSGGAGFRVLRIPN